MALPRIETFDGGAGVLDSTWSQQRDASTVNYDGSGAAISWASGSDTFAFDNSNVYPANQYCKLTIGTAPSAGTDWIGPTTRAAGIGDANYQNYVFYTDGTSGATHTELGRITADIMTVLRNFATTFGAADVMRLNSYSTEHECFKNDVSLGTHSDATHSAGAAGLRVFDFTGGTTVSASDWEAGSLQDQGPLRSRKLSTQQRMTA